MGATNIEFILKAKATKTEINKAFKLKRESDKDENGHRSGYSGDFQTVDRVEYHLNQTFETIGDAVDYCLDHAEKWETVIAVYFKSKQGDTRTLVCGWGAE